MSAKNKEETIVVIEINEEVKKIVNADMHLMVSTLLSDIISKSYLEDSTILHYSDETLKRLVTGVTIND
jgi:hypothetical protein